MTQQHAAQDVLVWVEQVATFLARDGVSPIAGRILGWLMICDPPRQSAAEIATAIGASRGSLTTNLRILMTMELVVRRTNSGSRTAYYCVDDHAWEKVVRRQIASLAAFNQIASAGMDMVGPNTPRADRIREAYDTLDWMARVFRDAPPMPTTKRPT